ncbi:MAG: thiamine-phosphate kinase [Vicinamibacterales bacterium]
MKVADLGEHALLARLLARLPRPPASVLVGPGDDAAVLAHVRNEHLVVTTDSLVEGVHYSRAYFAPADIGYKALAVNLSDLAAMGASPRWALLSLVLPGSWPVADVEGIMDGVVELAKVHGVAVVGGNISRTNGPLVVDVTLGGSVRPRRWLTRSGAKPGDSIYVSGTLGGARAGLEMLREGSRDAATGASGVATRREDSSALSGGPACIARQRRPEPRVRLGRAMAGAKAARAAMDLSDGLADALRQVAAASGCGVRVDAAALPIEPGARAWWTARDVDSVRAAVTGGEDYELLFAIPARGGGRLRNARRHVAEPAMTKIGVFTRDAGTLVLEREGRDEGLPEAYEHFRESGNLGTDDAHR